MKHLLRFTCLLVATLALALPAIAGEDGLHVATFDIDVTPPVGSELAYDTVVKKWDLGLRARGVVLLGANEPIVLCAVDWIGIGNEAHDAFRETLAQGAGTTPDRVAVHSLHQHDAPTCDFTTERILKERGFDPGPFNGDYAREVLPRLEAAVASALNAAQPLTHVGVGKAEVEKVASNRRILGDDGKVRAMRFTTCTDPELRAEPDGTIDPEVSLVSLWNGDAPLALLSYYAVHPQSYYRTGIPNPDFPGVARFMRQMAVPAATHIHFTGAGGNIGAGKYNDGSHENRLILAERLAGGMRRAWEQTEKTPLTPADVDWASEGVALPLPGYITREQVEASFAENPGFPGAPISSARRLAWLERRESGHEIDVTCLSLGPARILHLPGELFVEYQLAAKAAAPGHFVAMAAYGDYAPGYIGTAEAYEQGGYETSEQASRVAPESEAVLLGAIEALLQAAK